MTTTSTKGTDMLLMGENITFKVVLGKQRSESPYKAHVKPQKGDAFGKISSVGNYTKVKSQWGGGGGQGQKE